MFKVDTSTYHEVAIWSWFWGAASTSASPHISWRWRGWRCGTQRRCSDLLCCPDTEDETNLHGTDQEKTCQTSSGLKLMQSCDLSSRNSRLSHTKNCEHFNFVPCLFQVNVITTGVCFYRKRLPCQNKDGWTTVQSNWATEKRLMSYVFFLPLFLSDKNNTPTFPPSLWFLFSTSSNTCSRYTLRHFQTTSGTFQ